MFIRSDAVYFLLSLCIRGCKRSAIDFHIFIVRVYPTSDDVQALVAKRENPLASSYDILSHPFWGIIWQTG